MQRQANTFFTLQTALFTLHTSHSTLHLISPHLSSSHLIPSLLTCHLSKFLNCFHLFWFHPSTAQPFSSHQSSSSLISALLHSHAAITMPFAAPPTHPCSHYNAICIHTLQNTEGEPIRPRNDRSRTRCTQELTTTHYYCYFLLLTTTYYYLLLLILTSTYYY